MAKEITITQAKGPAKLRERMASKAVTTTAFASGTMDVFPTLSIKGKVFRIRKDGEEHKHLDANRQPIPFLDVVLVNSTKHFVKTYYAKAFTDNPDAFLPPDCWSMDGVRPDPSVVNKVNPTCADCPMNAFGSKVGGDYVGRAKACQDSKRVVVMQAVHIEHEDPLLLLVRVPYTSTKKMGNYAKYLDSNGYEPGACVTRISFNTDEAYPLLEFDFQRPLTDAEYDVILDIYESPKVKQMLMTAEFKQDQPTSQTHTQPQAQGFGTYAAAATSAPAEATIDERAQKLEEAEGNWIELPEGEGWLNELSGEIRADNPNAPAPELDPDVIATKDGRFFHKVKKAYVHSQYKAAEPVKEEPKKERKARPVPSGNGSKPEENKPSVAAASPKLEGILGGLVPKKTT